MPEPAPDEIVVSAKTLTRLVLEVGRLGRKLGEFGERVTHLEDVVKTSGLNGHAPAIKKLAEMAPELERRMNDPQMARLTQMVEQSMPTMEQFVTLAPAIIDSFKKATARSLFWKTAADYLKPLRYVFNLALAAAITAAAFILANAVWLHIHGLPG